MYTSWIIFITLTYIVPNLNLSIRIPFTDTSFSSSESCAIKESRHIQQDKEVPSRLIQEHAHLKMFHQQEVRLYGHELLVIDNFFAFSIQQSLIFKQHMLLKFHEDTRKFCSFLKSKGLICTLQFCTKSYVLTNCRIVQ